MVRIHPGPLLIVPNELVQEKIKAKETGQRLDIWLATKFHTKSRHWLKKEIKAGRVLINGQTKKPSYKLKEDDQIRINLRRPKAFALKPNPEIKVKILFENKDFLAVNKPANLSVHPGTPPRNNTLVNGLLARYPEIKNVGDNPRLRPGLVHRLDKDTSGIMLVAKNQDFFDWLKRQFQERKIEKKYLALVAGSPKKDAGAIETFISRSQSDPAKQKVVGKKEAFRQRNGLRPAKTKFRVKRRFKDYALVECWPRTGRMHQIRVHLKFIGCPIVGDPKYGPRQDKLSKKLSRQFLHAQSIAFNDSSGRHFELTSPLPPELMKIMENLE